MERRYKNTKDGYSKVNRGLKIIHIGGNIWKVGRIKQNIDSKHCVIYGPNREEYHIYNEETNWLRKDYESKYYNVAHSRKYHNLDEEYGSIVRRHGNDTIQSSVKIYILTSILDQRKNWCFDLTKLPEVGRLKVIYTNGTVKNIEFDGEFKSEKLRYNSIYPIGYRFQNI